MFLIADKSTSHNIFYFDFLVSGIVDELLVALTLIRFNPAWCCLYSRLINLKIDYKILTTGEAQL